MDLCYGLVKWIKIWIIIGLLYSVVDTQKTGKRSCECEYTVNGKCAYTLLLPTGGGESSCSKDSISSSEDLSHLRQNVSQLQEDTGNLAKAVINLQNSDSTSVLKTYSDEIQELQTLTQHNKDVIESLNTSVTSLGRSIPTDSSAKLEETQSLLKEVNNTVNKLDETVQAIIESQFLCRQKGVIVTGESNSQIPDENITASSSANDTVGPSAVRTNSSGSWCSEAEPNGEEWVQFDLGKVSTIYGIVTLGRADYSQWVTTYLFQYTDELAEDGSTTWTTYENVIGSDEVFQGNFDQNTPKVNWLWQPISSQYVRIRPLTANNNSNKCMRADIIGCVKSL